MTLPMPVLAAFTVDSAVITKVVFCLMVIGGTGFLYLTRKKK